MLTLKDSQSELVLSIETVTEDPPSLDRIRSTEGFLTSYDMLHGTLLAHIHNAYKQTKYAFPNEQIGKMYFLTAVTSKVNGEWWVVLEPGDVPSVYNQFMRFTIRDGKIVWANIN